MVDGDLFFETGGQISGSTAFTPAYVIVAPRDPPVVTAALKGDPQIKGFDFLYVRISALDAHFVELDPEQTLLVFVTNTDASTSRGALTYLKWTGTGEEFSMLVRAMKNEARASSVRDVKEFIAANLKRDFSKEIPLKPYQEHRFEYRGLKLGEFLSDHVDPDAELVDAFEKQSGFTLPSDYKEFLIQTNGGHLKTHVYFQPLGTKKKRALVSFIRFERGDHLLRNPHTYFEFGPAGFLTVAMDGKNEPLFLGLHPSIHGKVFSVSNACKDFYESDQSPALKAKLRGVRFVADSFTSFLSSLEITDERI